MKELLIVSTGRSGTNYFAAALRNFETLMVAYEVFNPWAVYGIEPALERLRELRGIDYAGHDDPRLVAFFRDSPVDAIDVLATIAEARNRHGLVVKLIAGQLEGARLDALLSRPGLRVLFVVRRRLDVYASQLKAIKLKRWQLARSEGIKADFVLQKFVVWALRQDAELARIRDRLQPGSFRAITYEAFVDAELPELVRRQHALLARIGVAVDLPEQLHSGANFLKQDTGRDPFAKFGDPFRIAADLEAAGLRDYALAPFLADAVEPCSHPLGR